MVRNAGMAWVMTFQSTSSAWDIINTPTRIETGAVVIRGGGRVLGQEGILGTIRY